MPAKSKYFHDVDLWHKFAGFEVELMKYVISTGVVALLVVAWVLTNPLFQLRDRMVARGRGQNKTQSQNY